MAVALVLCLALTAEASSKQKKKAVVTHKVGRTQLLDLHTSTCAVPPVPSAQRSLRVVQVFFDIEIDGKAEGEAAPALEQLQVNQ